MKQVMGSCGICGGDVSVPHVWHGINPPKPTCENCGATARGPKKPVLPMDAKPGGGGGPVTVF